MKKGWVKSKFGDVCQYRKDNGVHKNLQYVGMEHIGQGNGLLLGTIDSNSVLSTSFRFQKGDVLYGRLRPYLKKACVAEFEGCCSTEIFPIFSEHIDASFLKYWLLTDKTTTAINNTCSGCRMPRGNMNEVLNFDFYYPPLSEQKEIVEYLDSSFEKIDKLKENAAKNLEEAKALFQSALKEALESKKGWEYKALKDICTQLFAGGDVPKPNVSKKATTDFYIPIYSNGVENEGLYGYTDDARVNEPAVTISARGTIGALFRRYKPFFPAIRLITAVPNKDLLSVEFLFYALKVFTVRNSGTSIPQLTIPNIKKVTIPIPPLSEQQEIVSRLDSLNEKVNTLQQNYSRICDECDALKQAILRQVFE